LRLPCRFLWRENFVAGGILLSVGEYDEFDRIAIGDRRTVDRACIDAGLDGLLLRAGDRHEAGNEYQRDTGSQKSICR
jgi:hypothetical protein